MCKRQNILLIWLTALAAFSLISKTSAQTQVPPGPTSGEWTLAGSPYIVVDNITVPSGQTLTIDPGVTVLIASNLSITANAGVIHAVGTPSQRISIQSASSSYYFSQLLLEDSPDTNRFMYCDLANSQYGIAMVNGAGDMFTEIMNCSFSNCVNQGIYGQTYGGNYGATLYPTIKNCTFSSTGHGCWFYIYGEGINYPGGNATPIIIGNVFQNLTAPALLMQSGDYSAMSEATFINNTVVNCGVGVSTVDPWDVLVQDNIFLGCTNAVMVSGSLSRGISYNDFYQNPTNFTGLPAVYGQIIWNNRNGTPADASYNIYQNPLFIATNDFHLAANSPCVNAGTPNPAYVNMCFPPSISTNFPDQGTYGGPDACNWLVVVPKVPAHCSLTESNGSLWLNWGAIPRSTYQLQYLATNINANFGTNRWLTNTTLTAVSLPISIAVSPYPTTNSTTFFRVRSFGRTPGN